MDLLEESLASVQSSVSSLHRTLPTYVRYEIKLDRLEQIISNIWGTYSLLEFYQVNNGTILNSADKARLFRRTGRQWSVTLWRTLLSR